MGDERHALVPTGGTVQPPIPVQRPSGFSWVARRGIVSLLLIALLTGLGIWGVRQKVALRLVGLVSLGIAVFVCLTTASAAFWQAGPPMPLTLSLPILSTGDPVELVVNNTPLWQVNVSWLGLTAALAGIVAIAWSFTKEDFSIKAMLRFCGILLIGLGVLWQGDGAGWFYSLAGLAILLLLLIPAAWDWIVSNAKLASGIAEAKDARKRN